MFLMNAFTTGGAENVILRLAEQIDAERFSVSVCAFRIIKPEFHQRFRAKNVPTFTLGIKSSLQLLAGLWRFFILLRREKPRILYCYMTFPIILGALVGRLARVPVVLASERVMDFESRWRLMLKRLIAPLLDEVTVNSQKLRDFATGVIGYRSDRVSIIFNGVDVAALQPSGERLSMRSDFGIKLDETLIGCVARLNHQKGHLYLLRALKMLARPDIKLMFVGSGEMEAQLKAFCDKNGLSNQVIFAGNQQNIVPFLSMMDIFALPSLAEGFPNAVLEALAAGLPTIATDVGGTSEIVLDGETGLLIKARDSDAIATAIRRLIDDPALSARLARNGHKRVASTFSIERMVDDTEALFARQARSGDVKD